MIHNQFRADFEQSEVESCEIVLKISIGSFELSYYWKLGIQRIVKYKVCLIYS
jgi:hypothetical protein